MNGPLARMSKRERVLALAVGGILLTIVVLAAGNFLLGKQALLRSQIETKNGELQSLEILAAERDTWAKREMWLDTAQPKLANQSGAGVALLDEIKRIAKDQGVLLENPAIGLPDLKEHYHSMPVTIETKSDWKALVGFLRALQAPDRFLVVENAEIKVDGSDKTKMHGNFRIARWYAPENG